MLDGKRYDIIEKDSMSWQHDGKEWIIGVIQDDYEDDFFFFFFEYSIHSLPCNLQRGRKFVA